MPTPCPSTVPLSAPPAFRAEFPADHWMKEPHLHPRTPTATHVPRSMHRQPAGCCSSCTSLAYATRPPSPMPRPSSGRPPGATPRGFFLWFFYTASARTSNPGPPPPRRRLYEVEQAAVRLVEAVVGAEAGLGRKGRQSRIGAMECTPTFHGPALCSSHSDSRALSARAAAKTAASIASERPPVAGSASRGGCGPPRRSKQQAQAPGAVAWLVLPHDGASVAVAHST
jgi:hypothetical protein